MACDIGPRQLGDSSAASVRMAFQRREVSDIARQRLQELFLGRSGLTPFDIRMLFNLNGFGFLLCICPTELPQNDGQSTAVASVKVV